MSFLCYPLRWIIWELVTLIGGFQRLTICQVIPSGSVLIVCQCCQLWANFHTLLGSYQCIQTALRGMLTGCFYLHRYSTKTWNSEAIYYISGNYFAATESKPLTFKLVEERVQIKSDKCIFHSIHCTTFMFLSHWKPWQIWVKVTCDPYHVSDRFSQVSF